MFTLITNLIEAIYFIFPAYCANASPVIFGGGRPIDGGRLFLDKKPFFGSNKTVRGFFAGLIIGTLVGVVQKTILLGFMLSLGALIGDLIHSFIKRRLDMPPGSPFPIADQLDFILGAFLFSLPIHQPGLDIILLILIITPCLHFLTNLLAYLIGFKKNPW